MPSTLVRPAKSRVTPLEETASGYAAPPVTVMGRKPASLETKDRRKRSHAAKAGRVALVGLASTETLIRQRMRAVVDRMVRRFVPQERRYEPLFNRYDFWTLRRFGYDALAPDLRWTGAKDADGQKVLYPPELSPTWLWWTRDLHWRQRIAMSGGSRYILKGLCAAQERTAYGMHIHNPRIEVVRTKSHDFAGSDFTTLDEA